MVRTTYIHVLVVVGTQLLSCFFRTFWAGHRGDVLLKWSSNLVTLQAYIRGRPKFESHSRWFYLRAIIELKSVWRGRVHHSTIRRELSGMESTSGREG